MKRLFFIILILLIVLGGTFYFFNSRSQQVKQQIDLSSLTLSNFINSEFLIGEGLLDTNNMGCTSHYKFNKGNYQIEVYESHKCSGGNADWFSESYKIDSSDKSFLKIQQYPFLNCDYYSQKLRIEHASCSFEINSSNHQISVDIEENGLNGTPGGSDRYCFNQLIGNLTQKFVNCSTSIF